jgi:hypothetical protein
MINATMQRVLREKVFMISDEELWAARKARARRWARAGGTLHGYPSLSTEQETQETLDAEPPERNDKKQKPAPEPAA